MEIAVMLDELLQTAKKDEKLKQRLLATRQE